MAGRHPSSGRFTKKNHFSRITNIQKTTTSESDPIIVRPESVDASIQDHTYGLQEPTQPTARDTLSYVQTEIEVDTQDLEDECIDPTDAIYFDYVPLDLVPMDHCRFIVDLGFLAQQMISCQHCPSALHLCNGIGVRPYGFSGILYVQCSDCGRVSLIKLGKTHHSGNSKTKRGLGAFDVNTKAATGTISNQHDKV